MYTAIMKVGSDGRVAKFLDFETQVEADAHVAEFAGTYPDAVTVETHAAPIQHWRVSNGAVSVEAPAPTLADINVEHGRRILAGKTFSITGYGNVHPAGDDRTQTVLLALDRNAQRLKAAGETRPVLRFTDGNSVTHDLTPDQIIELVDKGTAWMQDMHEAKRAIKGQSPIPGDYTADKHWPA